MGRMARPRNLRSGKHQTARLWEFATRELLELHDALLALGMQKAGKDDLASALVWLAQRLPPEMVKSLIEAYLAEERADYVSGSKREGPDG